MAKRQSDTSPAVQLESFKTKHLTATLRWVNDPEVTHFIGTVFPVSAHEHTAWAARLRRDTDAKFFAIIAANGRHIGNAGVFARDRENNTARLFVYIGEKTYWERGAGTDATRLVCDYCFRTLKAHRVEATVFAYNPRAAASYRKAGFRLEARLREAQYHCGQYHDVLLLGKLRTDQIQGATQRTRRERVGRGE